MPQLLQSPKEISLQCVLCMRRRGKERSQSITRWDGQESETAAATHLAEGNLHGRVQAGEALLAQSNVKG